MTLTLEKPMLGLGEGFPDRVYVLFHPESQRYGCFNHEEIHGLACFSEESGVAQFAGLISLGGTETVDLSFDDAREVAKERPLPVISLMLLDDMHRPLIHFVR